MIPQSLTAIVAKLLRDMPRNPDIIALGEALKAAVAVTPVAATATINHVAATGCIVCEARRARQRTKMQKYRTKSKPAEIKSNGARR